jgi:hypothetical protein
MSGGITDVKGEGSILDILNLLDPTGKEYKKLHHVWDEHGSVVVPRSELPKNKLNESSIIGLEPPIFIVTSDSFTVADEKLTKLVQLLGLPEDPREYPAEYRAGSLRETLNKFLSYFGRNYPGVSKNDIPTMNTFRATSQSLKSFVLRVKDINESIVLLLFVDSKLIKRQLIESETYELYNEEVFDSQGRVTYKVGYDGDYENGFEYFLVDLPKPFYIEKDYIEDEDEDEFYVQYSVEDYSVFTGTIEITPKLYGLLIDYIKGKKEMMAQQFQDVVPFSKVPGIVNIIGNYL